MIAFPVQPYRPIPSSELDHLGAAGALAIRPLEITFERGGVRRYVETESASVAFAHLRAAAALGERVTHLAHGGLDADAESVATLNCYLRTKVAVGRCRLPFDRLPAAGDHRFGWSAFCDHLGLTFR